MTLAEFGKLVAGAESRDKPYTPATVSGWEQEVNEPTLAILRAIAVVGGIPKSEIGRFLLGESVAPVSATPLKKTPVRRARAENEPKPQQKRRGA